MRVVMIMATINEYKIAVTATVFDPCWGRNLKRRTCFYLVVVKKREISPKK